MLILATAITIALVVERITFAWVSLMFFVLGVGPDRKSVWFVSSLAQNCSSTATAIANSILRLFSVSLRSLAWCLFALSLWGALYVAMRYSAEGLTAIQRAYNSDVGGSIRLALVIPLEMLQLLWDGIVPVWNLLVYCVNTIPSRILFENVLRNMGEFKESIVHLALFVYKLVLSLFAYVKLIINPPDSFDPNLRLLDLITPLAEWRLAVSYMLSFLGEMCALGTSLLDVMMYPFIDINFGLGVHNTVNAILTLVIQVPAVTVDRCKAGGGPVVYCLPDFEPVIELAVLGIRNFGQLVDNWLDVTVIIIQSVLTATSPACNGWTVVDFGRGGGIMGANETVIVGISSSLFAKTDGWNVELYTRTSSTSLPNAFPMAMNVNYGVASVSASVDARGLLGCTCSDQDYGMQILCSVAPLDALTPAYYVPVEFRVPTTSFYMGCGRSKIRLDSIRWPATRHTSPNSRAINAPVAEAALWVRPACSSEWIDVACIETFKLAGCFPYCMALWTKGYTGSMILRSASEWQNSVAMMNRDCGLHTWDLKSGDVAAATDRLRQNSGVKNTWMDEEVQLNSSRCVYAPNTFSRMLRNTTGGAYASYRSVAITGQPFAFAGDLALTAVNTVGNTWGVSVHRIWGNQANEFTMIQVNKFIPALPPCATPSDCTVAANSCGRGRCRVAVPYSFDTTPWAHIPAVATDRFVFWITNPSMAMYISFNDWCANTGTNPRLAFEAESSYQSIQIWRLDPYEFCPTMPNGVRKCPEDQSATFRTLPGFVSGDHGSEVCLQRFYVLAPTITYVNEYNLAITILETSFRNVDASTLRPRNASDARCAASPCPTLASLLA